MIEKGIAQCEVRKRANVTVVAVKKPAEDIIFNPSPDIKIQTGDTLLVLGNLADINQFEKTYLGEAS